MDRVQKIRAEIEKAYNEAQNRVKLVKDEYWEGKVDAYRNVLCIFDSMQEEPTTSVWHDASEIPKFRKEFLAIVYTPTDVLKYVKTIYSEDEYCLIENDKWAYIGDLVNL